jgi:hypothetical protein
VKLSFLPGDLHLTTGPGGNYLVSLKGEVVCESPSQRRAIAAFNKIRKDLEAKFPPRPLSDREKSELYFKDTVDNQVRYKGLRLRRQDRKRTR